MTDLTSITNRQGQESSAAREFLVYLEKELPMLCDPADLVRVGLFKNQQSIIDARRHGRGPLHLKLGLKTYRWTKEAVITWVKQCAQQEAA